MKIVAAALLLMLAATGCQPYGSTVEQKNTTVPIHNPHIQCFKAPCP